MNASPRLVLLILLAVLIGVAVAAFSGDDELPTVKLAPVVTEPTTEVTQAGSEDDAIPENMLAQPSLIAIDETIADVVPDLGAPTVSDRELTPRQLEQQVALAQQKLAAIEAYNQRKQVIMSRVLEGEQSAEQSLLEAELAYRIQGWRQAWQAGDLFQYLSFYGDGFVPASGEPFDQWKAQRGQRIKPGLGIALSLSDFVIQYDKQTGHSLVMFKQHYREEGLEEHSNKRLVLAKQQGLWKIIAETSY